LKIVCRTEIPDGIHELTSLILCQHYQTFVCLQTEVIWNCNQMEHLCSVASPAVS